MSDPRLTDEVRQAARQAQFLNVVSRDEATRRFQMHLLLAPRGIEQVSLAATRERVLAEEICAEIDVPGFDRSNVDGFAVQASDTFEAQEERPRQLRLNPESILPGQIPQLTVHPGTASPIATGGMLPRGANAVVMIEETDLVDRDGATLLEIRRGVSPGNQITYAGTDLARGETVLWPGTRVTSREIGVLASLGRTAVSVFRRPRVAILSTGDEIVAPGDPLPLGSIYDSNAAILAAAVEECGCEPLFIGRVRDDLTELRKLLAVALESDAVLLSGGTSKGAGDLSYRVVQELTDPGIVVHGVALKPGKPICLAVSQGKPVVILPGFPTSAIFTFHEFVAPVLRRLAGQPLEQRGTLKARLPQRINSSRGRTEYVLVRLFEGAAARLAYPMGKGSGSVTTFSLADGFLTIPAQVEYLDVDEEVDVTLLDRNLREADLVAIGSHCTGLDQILSRLQRIGLRTSVMHVGSEAGLRAVQRGECDLAGVHLLDPGTDSYNLPFANEQIAIVRGYSREQCFVCRANDARFLDCSLEAALQQAVKDAECRLVNRNPGSGTRMLLDQLLSTLAPNSSWVTSLPGYAMQVKSHHAVVAAIEQGRADWGLAIAAVANQPELKLIPVRQEHYDFAIRRDRLQRAEIQQFIEQLRSPEVHQLLTEQGFQYEPDRIGSVLTPAD